MTACVTLSPSFASASERSFCRIIAEISGGLYSLPAITTRTSPAPAPGAGRRGAAAPGRGGPQRPAAEAVAGAEHSAAPPIGHVRPRLVGDRLVAGPLERLADLADALDAERAQRLGQPVVA